MIHMVQNISGEFAEIYFKRSFRSRNKTKIRLEIIRLHIDQIGIQGKLVSIHQKLF